ncbi:MAG: Uma2 family endonuclease [Anaerolineales bacterium]|nr:Uma2 family endonuclease [Anaerolineales bacterium]
MINQTALTAEAFDEMVFQPEYHDLRLEYIGGMIAEVVSNHYSSEIALYIGYALSAFVRTRKLGRITGADGGYVIGDERYIPDVAFVSKARQPDPCHEAYNPTPPDLAVEVLSPTDNQRHVRIKIVNYIAAGVTVWVVDPEAKHVEVYVPNQPVITVDENGVIEGGSVLPEFQLAVKAIFDLE